MGWLGQPSSRESGQCPTPVQRFLTSWRIRDTYSLRPALNIKAKCLHALTPETWSRRPAEEPKSLWEPSLFLRSSYLRDTQLRSKYLAGDRIHWGIQPSNRSFSLWEYLRICDFLSGCRRERIFHLRTEIWDYGLRIHRRSWENWCWEKNRI